MSYSLFSAMPIQFDFLFLTLPLFLHFLTSTMW